MEPYHVLGKDLIRTNKYQRWVKWGEIQILQSSTSQLSNWQKEDHYGLERGLGQFWRAKRFTKDQERILDISKMFIKGL